jgi:hypothetical protein
LAIASTYNTTITDAVVTIDGGGLDDGALTAAAGAITVCVDSATFSCTAQSIDVSCNQDMSEWHRVIKKGLEITLTKKVGNAEFAVTDPGGLILEGWDSSPTNSLFNITCQLGGKTCTFSVICTGFDINLDEPPTWTATFKAYGVAVGIA